MKSVIESYIGIWLITLFVMLCIAFTSINMNVVQAKNIFNSLKVEIQESNGSFIPTDTNGFLYVSDGADYDISKYPESKYTVSTSTKNKVKEFTLSEDGYAFMYTIERHTPVDADEQAGNETFKYNSIYERKLRYRYVVPIFGVQEYPLQTYVY